MKIDPHSPRKAATDHDGILRRLGDTDSDGYFVGFIGEDGTLWESCREHDTSVTAGRYHDAWYEWNDNGRIGKMPDPVEFAKRYCRRPCHVEAAAHEAAEQFNPANPLSRVLMAVRSQARAKRAAMN